MDIIMETLDLLPAWLSQRSSHIIQDNQIDPLGWSSWISCFKPFRPSAQKVRYTIRDNRYLMMCVKVERSRDHHAMQFALISQRTRLPANLDNFIRLKRWIIILWTIALRERVFLEFLWEFERSLVSTYFP